MTAAHHSAGSASAFAIELSSPLARNVVSEACALTQGQCGILLQVARAMTSGRWVHTAAEIASWTQAERDAAVAAIWEA